MRSSALIVLISILLAGCGGGAGNTSGNKTAQNIDLTGKWKIVLNENQSAPYQTSSPDSNNTRIAVSLIQSGTTVQADTNQQIYGGNLACNIAGFNTWAVWGSWQTNRISFSSGQVINDVVTIVVQEGNRNLDSNQAVGSLTFTGTVQPDGTLSGTLTDGCTLTNGSPTTNIQWNATKLSAFPPTTWP